MSDLESAGCRMRLDGREVVVVAPRGRITDADRAAIRECKPAIVAVLSARSLLTGAITTADAILSEWRFADRVASIQTATRQVATDAMTIMANAIDSHDQTKIGSSMLHVRFIARRIVEFANECVHPEMLFSQSRKRG